MIKNKDYYLTLANKYEILIKSEAPFVEKKMHSSFSVLTGIMSFIISILLSIVSIVLGAKNSPNIYSAFVTLFLLLGVAAAPICIIVSAVIALVNCKNAKDNAIIKYYVTSLYLNNILNFFILKKIGCNVDTNNELKDTIENFNKISKSLNGIIKFAKYELSDFIYREIDGTEILSNCKGDILNHLMKYVINNAIYNDEITMVDENSYKFNIKKNALLIRNSISTYYSIKPKMLRIKR